MKNIPSSPIDVQNNNNLFRPPATQQANKFIHRICRKLIHVRVQVVLLILVSVCVVFSPSAYFCLSAVSFVLSRHAVPALGGALLFVVEIKNQNTHAQAHERARTHSTCACCRLNKMYSLPLSLPPKSLSQALTAAFSPPHLYSSPAQFGNASFSLNLFSSLSNLLSIRLKLSCEALTEHIFSF